MFHGIIGSSIIKTIIAQDILDHLIGDKFKLKKKELIKINKSKLVPKILLSLVVLMTILSVSTIAKAGAPPFIWKYMQHPIISWGFDVQISHDEGCLWSVATATTEEEIETGFFPKPPFQQKLFIDGEKITLRRFTFYDEDGSIFGFPETKWWVYYHFFEAGYFDAGVYNIVHEMWVQKPYAGSEIYGWRIFINFEGPEDPYGPVGVPLILSYTLTVI